MKTAESPVLSFKKYTAPLLLLAVLAGCEAKDPQAGAQEAQDVSVVVMQPQRLVITTELSGRIAAFQMTEVRPQVGGIIQKRLFTEGADVKAGDILYKINPATYQASLDSAKANLALATADVPPARLKMERFRDLVRISAVSKQEYEDARAAYERALASEGVCRAAVESARIRLEYTNVTSPIAAGSAARM